MIKALIDKEDANAFRKMIDKSNRIALTCHVRPDGDALGSTLGMMHLLQNLGKDAKVITPDQGPKTLNFLPGFNEISSYSRYPEYSEQLLQNADLIICCDFNKASRQDALGEITAAATAPKVLIDHHLNPEKFCNLTFSFPEMSSTCELVFRLICAMGFVEAMPEKSAMCLATGIITDTRNLSVNCPDPELYVVMFELMKRGAEKHKEMILRNALMLKSADSFRLRVYALNEKLHLFPEHNAAIIMLDSDELNKFHYEKGDTEGLVNEPLNIEGIWQSYFLRQDKECIKVSARSINEFPVSKVCEELFGGGGHLQAAGAEYREGTITDCYGILKNALPIYDKYLSKH